MLGPGFRNVGTDLWRFEELWQATHGKSRCRHHLVRPAAVRHVKHQSAGSVGHVHRMFAGEPEADIVLGQKHPTESPPNLWFIVPHPQQFSQSEIRQRGVTGELDNPLLTYLLVQPIALRLRALIAPDKRRPEYLVIFVEQHGPMHLSGKTHGRDIGSRNASV